MVSDIALMPPFNNLKNLHEVRTLISQSLIYLVYMFLRVYQIMPFYNFLLHSGEITQHKDLACSFNLCLFIRLHIGTDFFTSEVDGGYLLWGYGDVVQSFYDSTSSRMIGLYRDAIKAKREVEGSAEAYGRLADGKVWKLRSTLI